MARVDEAPGVGLNCASEGLESVHSSVVDFPWRFVLVGEMGEWVSMSMSMGEAEPVEVEEGLHMEEVRERGRDEAGELVDEERPMREKEKERRVVRSSEDEQETL